jgi:hypothetical protein
MTDSESSLVSRYAAMLRHGGILGTPQLLPPGTGNKVSSTWCLPTLASNQAALFFSFLPPLFTTLPRNYANSIPFGYHSAALAEYGSRQELRHSSVRKSLPPAAISLIPKGTSSPSDELSYFSAKNCAGFVMSL